MIKRVFQLLAFAYLMMGCTDEEISIPFPVTNPPVRTSERQIKLSMSVVKNGSKDIKTGFSIFKYPTAPTGNFGIPVVYTDTHAGVVFSTTLQENRLISGIDYYIRSYIEFNDQRIYGNEVSFTTSTGFNQSITSVEPSNGNTNDIFEIHGQNFVPEFTTVKLRHHNTDKVFPVQVISITENKIVAKVPDTAGLYGTMNLNLDVYHYDGQQFISQSSFTIDPN